MKDDPDSLTLEPVASLKQLLYSTANLENTFPPPDLSSPESAAYLDHLLALPLASLLEEASLTSSEASTIESDLINLCYREYSTFISVHRCSSAVTSAFSDFSNSLSSLLSAVPALEEECKSFVKSTSGVQAARARAALVQEHQDKIFDLLEIPQLMGTCVRNGYYQEALELSAHAEQLASRYPTNQLIRDVAKEVDEVLQLMLAQLLALLREPIKLPSLMKAIGFLRKLDKIEEADLALIFLIGRLHNFHMQLIGIEKDRADVVRFVRRYIDIFREHVFDIISQFTTIFLDDPNSTFLASQLASFAEHCASELVEFISTNVPRMMTDAASLSSILIQLGYCSLSFARVGLDFASLVTEPFNSAVLQSYTEATTLATSDLTSGLKHANKTASSPSAVLLTSDYLSSILTSVSSPLFTPSIDSYEELPSVLSNFPPIAIFVNAHLSILNSLRLLAPFSLHPQLSLILSRSLVSGTTAILKYVQEAVDGLEPIATANVSESSRPGGHTKRTPSSPRAQLIRRNSETQMSPELRSAKRREAKLACVSFASAWIFLVCPFLNRSLDAGIYSVDQKNIDSKYASSLSELKAWLDAQHDVFESQTPVMSVATTQAVRITEEDIVRSPKTPDAIPEEEEHIERPELVTPEGGPRDSSEPLKESPVSPAIPEPEVATKQDSTSLEPAPEIDTGATLSSTVIENMFIPVALSEMESSIQQVGSPVAHPLPADLNSSPSSVTEHMEAVLQASEFTSTNIQLPVAAISSQAKSSSMVRDVEVPTTVKNGSAVIADADAEADDDDYEGNKQVLSVTQIDVSTTGDGVSEAMARGKDDEEIKVDNDNDKGDEDVPSPTPPGEINEDEGSDSPTAESPAPGGLPVPSTAASSKGSGSKKKKKKKAKH